MCYEVRFLRTNSYHLHWMNKTLHCQKLKNPLKSVRAREKEDNEIKRQKTVILLTSTS